MEIARGGGEASRSRNLHEGAYEAELGHRPLARHRPICGRAPHRMFGSSKVIFGKANRIKINRILIIQNCTAPI